MHRKAGACVVLCVNPGNGEEMRHLPEKKNGEQRKCYCIDLSPGGGPAHYRRRCARKCSDQGTKCRARFEGCINEDIASQGCDTQCCGQHVHEIEQIRDTGSRYDSGEKQSFIRQKPAVWQRTVPCTHHTSIEVTFEILISSPCPARSEACPHDRVKQ